MSVCAGTVLGGVAMLDGSAACGAAEFAANVSASVRFVSNVRELTESLRLVEVVLLRLMVLSVCAGTARSDVAMLVGSSACGPAETTASVLSTARFAQNACAAAESLVVVDEVVMLVLVLVVRVARGDVAISVGCPAVCGAAETAVLADLFAFVEFFDNSSAERLIWKLWMVGSFASLDGW